MFYNSRGNQKGNIFGGTWLLFWASVGLGVCTVFKGKGVGMVGA